MGDAIAQLELWPEEEWRWVPGYEGEYKVSSLGRVLSFKRDRAGKLLKPGHTTYGYARVNLSQNGQRTEFTVYWLVAAAFIGPHPEGMEIRHLDGDRTNDALYNLTYGTVSENQLDAVQHGTNWETAKTHCTRNHEYTPENTYWYVWGKGDGHRRRQCRTCNKIREAERKERRQQTGNRNKYKDAA